MPKLNSQKQWQREHVDKVKEYNTKYLAGKGRITITFLESDLERIDALKSTDKTRAEWIKQVVMEKLSGTQP